MSVRLLSLVALVAGLLLPATGSATVPPWYWATADGLTGEALRVALHQRVAGHDPVPYASSAYDVHDALEVLDAAPGDPDAVRLAYSDAVAPLDSWPEWNREHLWPQSLGAGEGSPAHSDLHHVVACDASVNTSRGNKAFHVCQDGCESHPESPQALSDGLIWEPPDATKGDIARALLYMDVRYEGGGGEPDLMLGDQPVATGCDCMGVLPTLLLWHALDPVDAREQTRNDLVYALQGNRNPFVDHPEWADALWSAPSSGPAPSATPWVNEVHYDNQGADSGEGVEIAGRAGTSLDGWTLVLENGNGATLYGQVELEGTLDDEQDGFGALWFPVPGLQNGPADAVALIDSFGDVVEHWSWEGTLVPAEGPAAGLMSIDMGVSQGPSTEGTSLQRQGVGLVGADFTWASGVLASPGSLNPGQVFEGVAPGMHRVRLPPMAWEDGVLLEAEFGADAAGDVHATGPALTVGADSWGRRQRAVLSFDTAGVPDGAQVVGAVLHLPLVARSDESPFGTLGALVAQPITGHLGSLRDLQTEDWDAPFDTADAFVVPPVGLGETAQVPLPVGSLQGIHAASRVQIRLAFPHPVPDHTRRVVLFASGDHPDPSVRPRLEILYQP